MTWSYSHQTWNLSRSPVTVISLTVLLSLILSGCMSGGAKVSSTEISISPQGSAYVGEGITVEIPEGSAVQETTLTLEEVSEDLPLPEDVAYLSPVFRLSGSLEAISGEILISFEIPEQALGDTSLAGDKLRETFYVEVLEEYVLESGPQEAFPGYRVPVTVDLDSNSVTARLDLGQAYAMGLASKLSAPAGLPGLTSGPSSIALRMGRTWTFQPTLLSVEGNFQAVYDSSLNVDLIDQLLVLLEEDKLLIENLGLSFAARTAYPITVQVKDIGNKDGNFSGSYFVNNRELNIHSKFFQSGAADAQMIKATAGHELLHLVQSLYYPQDYSYGANFTKFEWLDEASATWFESVVLGDGSWTPDVAVTNSDFFLTPLNFPADPAEHGYGASWYLRYLTQHAGLGLGFIPEVYQMAYQSGGSNSPGTALENALMARETTSADLWPEFLGTYLLEPDQLGSELQTTRYLKQLMISGVYEEDTGVPVQTFESSFYSADEIGSYNPSFIAGYPEQENSYPQVTLSASLGQLSGKAIMLSVNSDEDTKGIIKKPGLLKIDGFSDGIFSGVSVYGIPAGEGLSAAEPLAAPGGLEGPLGLNRNLVEVKGFGPDGIYDRVVLIFFNADPTVGELAQKSLSLTITFQPLEQCTFYTGEMFIEQASFTDPPCAAYQHCPDPNVDYGTGMGEGDPVEGQKDCSQAPSYCFEDGQITRLVEYMQLGDSLPFSFSLVNLGENFQARFDLDRNNENASTTLVYLYNDAQASNEDFQSLVEDGSIGLEIPYGLGSFSLTGYLGESQGSGSFYLYHPNLGDFVSGSWSAACQE